YAQGGTRPQGKWWRQHYGERYATGSNGSDGRGRGFSSRVPRAGAVSASGGGSNGLAGRARSPVGGRSAGRAAGAERNPPAAGSTAAGTTAASSGRAGASLSPKHHGRTTPAIRDHHGRERRRACGSGHHSAGSRPDRSRHRRRAGGRAK